MDRKIRYYLIILMVIISAAIIFSGCTEGKNLPEDTSINKGITQIRDFSINSGSAGLNTLAEGTVFIKGDGDIPEYVQIVSRVNIDPDDWGGVSFDIPAGWQVSGITSSYPENVTQGKPADYLATWTTADPDYEWNTRIEIGRGRNCVPTGGGKGTILIDLVPDRDATPMPGTFDIMVAVGSGEKNGVRILGTDFIKISVSLTDDGI